MTTPTRGERNNNPLNLNFIPGDYFVGQTGLEELPAGVKARPRFGRYDTIEHGLRAGAKQILIDYRKHRLDTVALLCASWAPPAENATAAYIHGVTCTFFALDPVTVTRDEMAFYRDEMLDMSKRETLAGLVKAIIIQENGRCIYRADQIAAAVAAALQP